MKRYYVLWKMDYYWDGEPHPVNCGIAHSEKDAQEWVDKGSQGGRGYDSVPELLKYSEEEVPS